MEESLAHPPVKFQRVLCAIDLGPDSLAVLQWASTFARDNEAKLTTVHAIPGSTDKGESEQDSRVANQTREQISFWQEDLGITGDIVVKVGDVPDTIRAIAKGSAADLLVTGRGHASGVLGRLRANTYSIIRESPCPVVAI